MEVPDIPKEIPSSPPKKQLPFHPEKRNKVLLWVSISLFLIGSAYFIYWFTYGRFHEFTDDAYVSGNTVMITTQVPGIVTTIYVQDTDYVIKNTPLVQLDRTDHEIALEKSKKELAETVRDVAKLFADAS